MSSKLHIQDQARLPLSQQAELVFDGMRHRFFRTLLTWTVVTLAVAFVCYVMAEQKIVDAADRHAALELDRFTPLQRLASWIDQPTAARQLQRRVAMMDPQATDAWEFDALRGLLALDAQAGGKFESESRIWTHGEAWFDNLSLGNRRVIFGVTQWPDAVEKLASPASLEPIKQAANDAVVRLPGDVIKLAPTRKQYLNELARHVRKLDARRKAAADTLAGQPLLQWLGEADRTEAQVSAFLAGLGVKLPPPRYKALIEQSREYQQVLAYSLQQAQAGPSQAVNATQPAASQPTADAISDKAMAIHRQQTAADAMRLRIAQGYPGRDQPNRTPWLVGTAFLVCLAGVSNAMLVSVLERFREIATMKCLGAMDGFIGTIFLAEASIIGLIGGVAGGLLGILAAVARVGWALGSGGLATVNFAELGVILLMGIACGWLLAVLSSIYPAIAAARMPPMAAMRVD